MEDSIHRLAVFEGLVYSDDDQFVNVAMVGNEAHYVVLDAGFKRHIPAEVVDRQVVEWLRDQAMANKEMVSENIMTMLGKDDLFTKAMVDASIGNIDQMMNYGLPEDSRIMLGMMGFRLVINVHGEIVEMKLPGQDSSDVRDLL